MGVERIGDLAHTHFSRPTTPSPPVNGFNVLGDGTVYTHDNITRSIRVNYMRMTLRNILDI